MRFLRFASVALSLSAVAVLSGCGGSSSTPSNPTLTISPTSAAIVAGQTTQFTATANFSNSVQWAVDGIAGGNNTLGTVTSSGLYTAPSGKNAETVTVSALDVSSPSVMASAQVSVIGAAQVNTTNNGQVASYTVALPGSGTLSVNFGSSTMYGRNTWTVNSNGGTATVYVAGMIPNTAYHLQGVVTINGNTINEPDQTFTTTQSIPKAKLPTITAISTGTPQPGVELLGDLTYGALAYDLQGNLLWGYNPPDNTAASNVEPAKLWPDGNILVEIAPLSTYPLGGAPPAGSVFEIREVDLGGNVVRTLNLATLQANLNAFGYKNVAQGITPTLLDIHHEVTLNPSTGHWLILANYIQPVTLTGAGSPTNVLGDIVLDVDPSNNFAVTWVFDEFNSLDPNRGPLQFPDWTHSNAIAYSPTDKNIIVSIRNQNWVIKVNYQDGMGDSSILWKLGYQGDFQLLDANGSPDPNTQDWEYAQHEPSFPDLNNTAGASFPVTLMDDGDDRTFTPGYTCPVGLSNGQCLYSRAPIFTLNETAKTATLTNPAPSPYYTYFGGNAEVLANGDSEADYCAAGQVLETTVGNSPQTIWQFTQTTPIYRAHRIPSLYPGVQWTQ